MDIFHKYVNAIKKSPENVEYYSYALNCCKYIFKAGNVNYALKCTTDLKELCKRTIKNETTLNTVKVALYDFIQDILIVESPYGLDSYFLALEYTRPIQQQFYLPRRKQLKPIVHELERLLISDEIDELFLSMPPRTGKTTLIIFVISWLIGFKPELANLYVTYSTDTAKGFYDGVYEILNDEITYSWHKIFPDVEFDKTSMCNSKESYLDTGRKKRFHSITCRSIDGSLNGKCDCNGILIGDDLISGIEEALNPTRVKSVNSKVRNDMQSRKKEFAKQLWIGTRWTINDPIGERIATIESEPVYKNHRYKVINVPALNENDESNFDYEYGVGFSSQAYLEIRSAFDRAGDIASWNAQYMGQPVERNGLLFPPDELMYFDKLPDEVPTKIVAPVDVAWGGGDACSCPCLYVYKDKNIKNSYEVYIPAVVFEYGDKSKSQPEIARMVFEHNIGHLRIEKNNGGAEYRDDLDRIFKEKGITCNIDCKSAPTKVAKEGKIFASAPDIKAHFHFLKSGLRNDQYQKFMQQLFLYTINGSNKQKDDAPDSLAQGNDMIKTPSAPTFTIFQRPF